MVLTAAVRVASFLLALAPTPRVRAMAICLRALDHPREPMFHRLPIPRIGGVAVALSFCLFRFLALVLDEGSCGNTPKHLN